MELFFFTWTYYLHFVWFYRNVGKHTENFTKRYPLSMPIGIECGYLHIHVFQENQCGYPRSKRYPLSITIGNESGYLEFHVF